MANASDSMLIADVQADTRAGGIRRLHSQLMGLRGRHCANSDNRDASKDNA